MKRIVITLVSLLGLSAWSALAVAGDPVAGEQKTATCAACHGADGNSDLAMNPKLAGQNVRYTFKQLVDIRDGNRPVPLMTGLLDNMSDQDLRDIAAFYAEQEITLEGADPDLIALGRQIYRAGIADLGIAACSACHSPTGQGVAQAGFPALGGQHVDYTVQQMQDFRSGSRDNDGDAAPMRIIAERLTDREIEALASYISGLH